MENKLFLEENLQKQQALLHELQFRDKIKSSEYHYAIGFEFDGFFDEQELIKDFFEKIHFLSRELEFSTFKLGISWPEIEDAQKSHLKHSIQTSLIEMISTKLGKALSMDLPDLEFLIDFNKKLVFVRVNPVFVRGNYCKYSREIAQTEFFCNKCRGVGCWYCQGTGHFSKESVEELLGKILVPAFGGKLAVLHGAGREDMDVLMLGKGRPFIVEVLMPFKRSADLSKLSNEINSKFKDKISVNFFRVVSHSEVSVLKDSFHDKVYAALVAADTDADFANISLNKKIAVSQKTPTRVQKRRAGLERQKEVTLLRIGEISKKEFVLVMRTSHGTYVKEFISGDNGRTSPSISSLLSSHCTCKLLDVLEVCD
jgi:tRNA pseudouridine synthase 10